MHPSSWPIPYPLGINWILICRWIPKTYSYIQVYDLSIWLANRHQSSLKLSYLWWYPSNETFNPISINKHLLGSLIQWKIYSDIQPYKIVNELKTLVLKHKRSLIKTEGDENHNETKRLKLFVLISLKAIQHLHMRT